MDKKLQGRVIRRRRLYADTCAQAILVGFRTTEQESEWSFVNTAFWPFHNSLHGCVCNIYKLAFHRLRFVLIFEGRLELRKLVSTDQSKFAHSLPSPSHCPSDSLNLFSRLFTYFEMFVIQYATSCLSMNIQFAFRAALVSHIRKKCIKKRTTNSPQARDQ